ncbi:MAG: hypothetical protein ACR2RL_05155 [Gammaproteobacteria bacterium]
MKFEVTTDELLSRLALLLLGEEKLQATVAELEAKLSECQSDNESLAAQLEASRATNGSARAAKNALKPE